MGTLSTYNNSSTTTVNIRMAYNAKLFALLLIGLTILSASGVESLKCYECGPSKECGDRSSMKPVDCSHDNDIPQSCYKLETPLGIVTRGCIYTKDKDTCSAVGSGCSACSTDLCNLASGVTAVPITTLMGLILT